MKSSLRIDHYRLWELADPFLYRVSAQLQDARGRATQQLSARCGFRDFRKVNGYFRLNDRRLFVRSTHGDGCPTFVPPRKTPDLLRRDIVYAKASGFNMIRFLNSLGTPDQLDLCDEVGLMVYEESVASWHMPDGPRMKEQFARSVGDMIRRDRNHPSITIWGLLNETSDGPVFREAVSSLSMMRALDPDRVVALSSGRWDGERSVASFSNPGSTLWDCYRGQEGAGKA